MALPTLLAGSGAFTNAAVLSSQPCKLLSVTVYNGGADAVFLLVFDSGNVPANKTAPTLPAIPVAAGNVLMFDFGTNGVDLDALTVAVSTTADQLARIAATDYAFSAVLKG